jgi:type VI secretion system secreted protein VgrG
MSRTFILHSPLDDELKFLSMTGTEELSKVSAFEVRALSLNPDIDATAMLGKNVTVEVITQEGNSRFLDGICTQFAYKQPESGASRQHVYSIKLQSWLALAEKRSDSRTFQRKNIPDIIKAVLQDFGLPVEFKLTETYKPRRYVVQYQETNLNLVMRLAEEVGIYFYTKHALGSHTIVFTDGIHSTLPEYDSIEYLTPGTRPMEADEYIKEWNVVHEVQSGKYVTDSYNFQAPNANLQRNDQKQNDHAFDSLEIYDFHGGYPEHDDGTKIAKTRLEQQQRNFLNISGETNVRGMAPGYFFNLTDHPSRAQNAEYLITKATYFFQENQPGSKQKETTWNIHFDAKPSSVRFQPENVTKKPVISGPQSAIVTGPKGADHWCDKWGRVVIQFPWDRYGNNDENSSCWVRVSSPWAGSNYGGVHVPRIGQEVIVEFLQGNPDLPIITGRVYNDSQMPPWDLPANATQSGFISRSTGTGSGKDNANALRFEDKKGQEHVWLQAEKDMQTVVENNDTQTVGANRVIDVGGTHTETIKKDISVTSTDATYSLTAKTGITITSNSKEIVLTVGKSTIAMDEDGNILIKGVKITVESDTSIVHNTKVINSIASDEHLIKGGPVQVNP